MSLSAWVGMLACTLAAAALAAGNDEEHEFWTAVEATLKPQPGCGVSAACSGDWDLIAQQAARERGVPLRVVRAQADPEDAIRDPDVIRPVVKQWRDQLSESLSEHLSAPLDWDEEANTPYFTDKPAWDYYSDLMLCAAYSEHPELVRPEDSVEDFGHDSAYAEHCERF